MKRILFILSILFVLFMSNGSAYAIGYDCKNKEIKGCTYCQDGRLLGCRGYCSHTLEDNEYLEDLFNLIIYDYRYNKGFDKDISDVLIIGRAMFNQAKGYGRFFSDHDNGVLKFFDNPSKGELYMIDYVCGYMQSVIMYFHKRGGIKHKWVTSDELIQKYDPERVEKLFSLKTKRGEEYRETDGYKNKIKNKDNTNNNNKTITHENSENSTIQKKDNELTKYKEALYNGLTKKRADLYVSIGQTALNHPKKDIVKKLAYTFKSSKDKETKLVGDYLYALLNL